MSFEHNNNEGGGRSQDGFYQLGGASTCRSQICRSTVQTHTQLISDDDFRFRFRTVDIPDMNQDKKTPRGRFKGLLLFLRSLSHTGDRRSFQCHNCGLILRHRFLDVCFQNILTRKRKPHMRTGPAY